jgi:hypothetical protein
MRKDPEERQLCLHFEASTFGSERTVDSPCGTGVSPASAQVLQLSSMRRRQAQSSIESGNAGVQDILQQAIARVRLF